MKIGRNDPCFCGSGKKYKKCCLGKVVPSAELDYERVSLTYDHLVEKLFKFMEKRFGSLAIILAMEEFYCWSEDFYERLEEAGEGVADWLDEILEEHAQCFIPWFLFNWTYDPDCDDDELLTSTTPVFQTVAECYVEEKKSRLDEGER
ncbi:MAG: SEC-C metal-binding domain-containing protein, partial [Pseudomonadota bacterium]|nr:SEC-C metal-binding domain-containing protein [Pseudomonadota bacterium]